MLYISFCYNHYAKKIIILYVAFSQLNNIAFVNGKKKLFPLKRFLVSYIVSS